MKNCLFGRQSVSAVFFVQKTDFHPFFTLDFHIFTPTGCTKLSFYVVKYKQDSIYAIEN